MTVRFRRACAAAALRLGASLALIACTGGGRASVVSTASPARAEELRAMTFNIRYGTAPDGINAWPLRRALTFQVIRDFAPAVLGVQEALRFQLDELENEMPGFAEIGAGRDDGVEKGEYSAILYVSARLEALEHGTFWLSDTPAVPGSMTWGNKFPRIVTWARFRDRDAGNSTFYVFNTHWDHESQPSRERSSALLMKRIRERAHAADPVLVMGDFNSGEDNPAFQALLAAPIGAKASARLYDTFRAVAADAQNFGTFNGFRGDRSGPKIDAILASPDWQTVAADIVLLSDGGVYPSDHFPVTATLRQIR